MPQIPPTDPLTDDLALIRKYKATTELRYVGDLFNKYLPLVYGVCLRYFEEEPAKDAAMEVFEILADKLKQHEVYNFKSWLHVLTRNHCLMILREKKRNEGHLSQLNETQLMEKDLSVHHEKDNGIALEEDLQALEKCLETLSPEQKVSVDLFYLKEKCYREIADQTGFELKKVKSYIQNGKRNLKNCIEKQQHA